jgi:hypothetical protein
LGFIGEYHAVEERESRCIARAQIDGVADVPDRPAWRPLGTGGLTWRGEGEPAEAAWAVGGLAREHVVRRRAAWACRKLGKRPAAAESRARQKQSREDGRLKTGTLLQNPKIAGTPL